MRYRGRISGPLLDRVDIHLEVPSLGVSEVMEERWEESSEAIRARVLAARAVQQERFREHVGVHCNAHMIMRHKDGRTYPIPNHKELGTEWSMTALKS